MTLVALLLVIGLLLTLTGAIGQWTFRTKRILLISGPVVILIAIVLWYFGIGSATEFFNADQT